MNPPCSNNYHNMTMTFMTSYDSEPVKEQLVQAFFACAGDYPGKQRTLQSISQIWRSVLFKYGTAVFDSMERGDCRSLAQMYSNYYHNGISDGACGGAKLKNPIVQARYFLRNNRRIDLFANQMSINNARQARNEIVGRIFSEFSIPPSILLGRPWGWRYGGEFMHSELIDHLYFADAISRVIRTFKIRSATYIGDGSGILSGLVNANNQLSEVCFIDLAQYLLRQFLVNQGILGNARYLYAETFTPTQLGQVDLIINQDSFPEIPEAQLRNYFQIAGEGRLKFLLSYNQEPIDTCHSRFRPLLLERGMESVYRYESPLRPGWFIELFKSHAITLH